MTIYDIDKKKGTNHSKRVVRYREYLEDNDRSMSGAVTDAKRDCNLRPSEQKMFFYDVKIVERRTNGVVAAGCKIHMTSASVTNELLTLPTTDKKHFYDRMCRRMERRQYAWRRFSSCPEGFNRVRAQCNKVDEQILEFEVGN